MKIKKSLPTAIMHVWLGILLSAWIGSTHAATAITGIPSTGAVTGTTNLTLGWDFVALTDMSVTHLGILDTGGMLGLGDGLAESHQVGLWSSTGSLLASVIIPAGVGADEVGGFRFASIAPVSLFAGTSYVVGAHYLTSADGLGDDGINGWEFTFDPSISSVDRRVNFTPGFGYPADVFSAVPAIGPNFMFTPVPVPAAVWLFGSGVLGLIGIARRKRVAT